MTVFDQTFACQGDSLDTVSALVGACLDVTLKELYSECLGGDYFFAKNGVEEVRVVRNQELDGTPAEVGVDLPFLILIDATSRQQSIKERLTQAGAALIREKSYDV